MRRDLTPIWSAEQKAAGDRMREAWEEFFRRAPAREPAEPLAGQDARLLDVRTRHEADLMRYPNVVGVADGVRMRGGKPTGQRSIIVYVERKVPPTDLPQRDLLPQEIEGIPVDVVETGRIVPLSP